MDIVITFLKPSKFYITSKNQRPVTSTSGKVGGARLRRFMVMSTIEVQKKLRSRATMDDPWTLASSLVMSVHGTLMYLNLGGPMRGNIFQYEYQHHTTP